MAYYNKPYESSEPKFANWNKWYDDLFQEQKEIRAVGVIVMSDLNNHKYSLQYYCSRVSNLFSTHKHYIETSEKVQKELDKIEEFLFSDAYIIAKGQNAKSVRTSELRTFKTLKGIFTTMCEDFSKQGLSVRVDVTTRVKQSDLEDDEDKKQELEDLEEAGMI